MSAIDNLRGRYDIPTHSHLWNLLILTIVQYSITKPFGAHWFLFFTQRFVAQASLPLMTDILEKLRIFPECPAMPVCQHYKYAERPWANKDRQLYACQIAADIFPRCLVSQPNRVNAGALTVCPWVLQNHPLSLLMILYKLERKQGWELFEVRSWRCFWLRMETGRWKHSLTLVLFFVASYAKGNSFIPYF